MDFWVSRHREVDSMARRHTTSHLNCGSIFASGDSSVSLYWLNQPRLSAIGSLTLDSCNLWTDNDMTCSGSEFALEMAASILFQEKRDYLTIGQVTLFESYWTEVKGTIWKLLQSQFHGTAGTRNIVIGNGWFGGCCLEIFLFAASGNPLIV